MPSHLVPGEPNPVAVLLIYNFALADTPLKALVPTVGAAVAKYFSVTKVDA
jgi:hypothetical protein